MTGCAARNCKNSSDKGYKMYRIPFSKKDPERREIWLKNIGRKGYSPSLGSGALCEEHFEQEQFELLIPGKLKPNAIPTVFHKYREPEPKCKPNTGNLALMPAPSSSSSSRRSRARTSVPAISQKVLAIEAAPTESSISSIMVPGLLMLPPPPPTAPEMATSSDVIDQQKKKIKSQRNRIRDLLATNRTTEGRLKRFLNNDQIESLGTSNTSAVNWSESTIKKALRVRETCGHNGYVILRAQGFPLPSEELLQRRIEPQLEDQLQTFLSKVDALFEEIGSLPLDDQKKVVKKLRSTLVCHEKAITLRDKENKQDAKPGEKMTRISTRKRTLSLKAEALHGTEPQQECEPCIVKVVRLDNPAANDTDQSEQPLESEVGDELQQTENSWVVDIHEEASNEGTDSDMDNEDDETGEEEEEGEGERYFNCPFCSFTSRLELSLKCHLRSHKEEEQFVCELCEKSFPDKPRLEEHLKVHGGHKILECALCDFHATYNMDMIKHMSNHIGEKPHLGEKTPYSVRKVTALKFNKLNENAQSNQSESCAATRENVAQVSEMQHENRLHERREVNFMPEMRMVSDLSKRRDTTGAFDVFSEAIQTLRVPVQDGSTCDTSRMESGNVPFGIPSDLFVIELVSDDNDPH